MTRNDFIAAAVLALTLFVTGSQRMVPGVVGGFNDDAIYAATAISLADGEGYRLHGFPGSPRQPKYPILYPA